jgi:hypothetical protein
MNDEKFKQKLENDRDKPLYKNWKKYHHVERLGNTKVNGILDGTVVIQTKVDGANLSVFWDEEDGLMIASRNNLIYREKETGIINEFRGAVDYATTHEGIKEFVKSGKILRLEWLVRHTLSYDKQSWKKAYAFDVEDKNGVILNFLDFIPELERLNILYVKPVCVLQNPKAEELIPLTQGPDEFGAAQKEGVVVKNYSYRNNYGRQCFAKLLSPDFKVKNKLAWSAGNGDPPEMKFATDFVTREFVLKTIHTIADNEGEETTIRHMSEVLGRVYYDLFQEELWDYVKNRRVKAFNFADLHKYVVERTREIALDFYNGVPSIHD